jgi:phage tail sheath protein FI
VQRFFANGGDLLWVLRCELEPASIARGLAKLTGPVGLLALPGVHSLQVLAPAIAWVKHRSTPLLLLDGPPSVSGEEGIQAIEDYRRSLGDLSQAALYYPWAVDEAKLPLPPSGFVAGIFARVDREHGVLGSSAGLETTLVGAAGLTVALSDAEQTRLNDAGINGVRHFPGVGTVLWGSRTLALGEQDPYRNIRVRRLVDAIARSLQSGLAWTMLQSNSANTWSRVQQQDSAFVDGLWKQGLLQGASRGQAYWVQCNAGNNTPDGPLLHLDVGLAVLAPEDFVILELSWPVGS